MSFAAVSMVDGWDTGWLGTDIAVDVMVIGWLGSGLLDVETGFSVTGVIQVLAFLLADAAFDFDAEAAYGDNDLRRKARSILS